MKEAYYRLASPTENGERVASVAYGILREDWQSGELIPLHWEKDSFFQAIDSKHLSRFGNGLIRRWDFSPRRHLPGSTHTIAL